MASGLIAAALSGFGKALSTTGEMEAKKQNELDLRKQLMAAESEERLRVDEITGKRAIERIKPTAEATAQANLVTAPINAKATVAGNVATLTESKAQNLSTLQAEADASKTVASLDAGKKFEVDRRQAEANANKRVEELNAEKKLNITMLEAERGARVEKEKYEAMVTAGVSKAKADALMAEYNSGDPLRKKQAQDNIDAEISKAKTLGGSKEYLKGTAAIKVAENAGDIAEVREREKAYRDRPDKKGAETTKDLERQANAANDDLARELGVPKNKLNEEIGSLQKKAAKGDRKAADILDRIAPQLDDWKAINRKLRDWKRDSSSSGSDSESGKGTAGLEKFDK
jgi:hypothetical protein